MSKEADTKMAEMVPGFKGLVATASTFHESKLAEAAVKGKKARLVWLPFAERVKAMQANQQQAAPGDRGAPVIRVHRDRPTKLIIEQYQSPGDVLMLTATIRDLHVAYPGRFITDVRTSCPHLWEANKDITPISDDDPDAQKYLAEYKLIDESNEGPWHFIFGFHDDFERKTGIPVRPTKFWPYVALAEHEKGWLSQIYELTGKDLPYWIIDAGRKDDFTAKMWNTDSFQEVVERMPDITFVQIGADDPKHYHPELHGDNIINLIGKTDTRQFVRLMYHAAGVITPVSFPMHLAAAVETKYCYKRPRRPCVVLAGGREPASWEGYTNHAYLHKCGRLPCCDNGGCWASRVVPIGDGDEKDTKNLCNNVVYSESNQPLPLCLDLITPEDVIRAVREYLMFYDYSDPDPDKWHIMDTPRELVI